MPKARHLAVFALCTGALLTAVFQTTRAQPTGQDGAMSAELRSQVEALKEDLQRSPTDGSNLAERTPVVWDWINAYALAGGAVPTSATGILQSAFRELVEAEREGREPRVALDQRPDGRAIYADARIDQVIEELRLKDEEPGALGTFSLSSSGPFTADSWITIEQTYTVGDLPMKQGARVVVGRNSQWDRGGLQNEGPGDGYVTIKSSSPSARFAKIDLVLGTGRYRAVRPTFRLEQGTLGKGESFTLVYGDKSGGGRGWRLFTYENDLTLLPVNIDHSGDGRFPTHPWPAFKVVGAGVARAKGFAPSIVEPGETFELAVRSEDVNFNRATGEIPAYEVTLNGRSFRDLPAGGPALNMVGDLRLDEEGVYRFDIESADGRDHRKQQPGLGPPRSSPPHLLGRDPLPTPGWRKVRARSTAPTAMPATMPSWTSTECPSTTPRWTTSNGRTSARASSVTTIRASSSPSWATSGPSSAATAATTTSSTASPSPLASALRRRPIWLCSTKVCASSTTPTMSSSFPTPTNRATGATATPTWRPWSRSCRCTAPSNGSETITCVEGTKSGLSRPRTTTEPTPATPAPAPEG